MMIPRYGIHSHLLHLTAPDPNIALVLFPTIFNPYFSCFYVAGEICAFNLLPILLLRILLSSSIFIIPLYLYMHEGQLHYMFIFCL